MTGLSKLMYAALLALTLSAPVMAADSGRVPLPNIPEPANGTKCVEPEDVMRRNHMEYLKAHRDETMHKGIRTTKYSLKACIECHAAPEASNEAVAAGKEKAQGHFCQNCHQYAGIKIDCFECHASKPEGNASMHPIVTPGMREMSEAHEGSAAMLNEMAEKGAAK